MSNTPSSSHSSNCYYGGQDHPRRTCSGDIITEEGGILQIIHHSAAIPDPEPIPVEEQQEASMRYIKEKYGSSGVYDKMIRRTTDGSDPLVQEPKGKP